MTKKSKTKTKRSTTKALSERALFELATEFETSKARAKKYVDDPKVGWKSIQSRIVSELQRRKTKSLTASGSLTKITLIAPEPVVYDEQGLWADLTPAKRRLVFDRQINLSKLSRADQEALLAVLSPAQKRTVVSHALNVDKLAQAQQDGKVSVSLIAEHSEIKPTTPYIAVSHGEPS